MKWLNKSVDISSLVFFRIAFGILAVSEMTAQITYKHWYKNFYGVDEFHFHYIGFEWIIPFPEPFMSLFLIFIWLLGFAILLGYKYRLATILFFLGYSYVYLLEKGLYLNHGYLFCWLSLVMAFLPANRALSWDVYKRPELRLSAIPYWPIAVLCFLMSVVYFFGGIAKINPDWLRGVPLIAWVGYKSDMPLLGWLWALPATAIVMSYLGLFVDLFAPIFLSWKKSRIYFFIALVIFHLTNSLLFKIGIFPWLSICITALFFPPDWPRIFWNYLKNRFSKANALDQWFGKKFSAEVPKREYPDLKTGGLALIVLLVLIHISLPLRHHLFLGNVAWTEEGHRYSWRMMLRSKSGHGHFLVKEKNSDREVQEKGKDWMSSKLSRKLHTHPDMIWQFAQHLEAHYKDLGWEDPQVYAKIRAKLNDRKYQPFIDENVDLAAEEWNFFKAKNWILPLESEQVESN